MNHANPFVTFLIEQHDDITIFFFVPQNDNEKTQNKRIYIRDWHEHTLKKLKMDNNSTIDLPDEILLIILKKVNAIDIRSSLVDVNERFDRLIVDYTSSNIYSNSFQTLSKYVLNMKS